MFKAKNIAKCIFYLFKVQNSSKYAGRLRFLKKHLRRIIIYSKIEEDKVEN